MYLARPAPSCLEDRVPSVPPPSASSLSPCIGVCALDKERHICTGCGRTLAEIAGWSTMDDAERQVIMRRLNETRAEWDT